VRAGAMVTARAASAATPVGTRGTASAERVRKATSAESTRCVVSVAHTSVLMPHADPAFLRGTQDCASNACGRSQWGSDQLQCVDDWFTCLGKDYAYQSQEDGSACRCDGSCQSGFCRDTGGYTRDGKCGKGQKGDKCGINKVRSKCTSVLMPHADPACLRGAQDCASDACARPSWSSDKLQCVDDWFTCLGKDYAFGTQPDGSACRCDGSCQSGFCRDTGGYTRDGKCGKGQKGDKCGINKVRSKCCTHFRAHAPR